MFAILSWEHVCKQTTKMCVKMWRTQTYFLPNSGCSLIHQKKGFCFWPGCWFMVCRDRARNAQLEKSSSNPNQTIAKRFVFGGYSKHYITRPQIIHETYYIIWINGTVSIPILDFDTIQKPLETKDGRFDVLYLKRQQWFSNRSIHTLLPVGPMDAACFASAPGWESQLHSSKRAR